MREERTKEREKVKPPTEIDQEAYAIDLAAGMKDSALQKK